MKIRVYVKGGSEFEAEGKVEFENGWLIVRSKSDPKEFTAYSDEQVLKVVVSPAEA